MTWSNGIKLDGILAKVRDGGNKGLRLGAEHVLGVSTQHVPIEEATLSRSGKVSVDEAALRSAVSYDTPYAVVQHEDQSLEHDSGRTAKFLENALNGERPTVGKIITTEIRRELGTEMPEPTAETFETAFLEGFAQLLAADPAVGTWKSSGVYAAGETGIVLGGLPQGPDRVIALASYPVADDPSLSDSTIGLQVLTRWGGADPREIGKLVRVFDRLHGLHDTDLATGVHVVQCLRRSGASLGQDANSRWRTSQNFYVDVHRPSANRT